MLFFCLRRKVTRARAVSRDPLLSARYSSPAKARSAAAATAASPAPPAPPALVAGPGLDPVLEPVPVPVVVAESATESSQCVSLATRSRVDTWGTPGMGLCTLTRSSLWRRLRDDSWLHFAKPVK